jgi:hypothetical protein
VTVITVTSRGDMIIGLTAEGHSGYAESGSDIICAAVSTAFQFTSIELTECLGIEFEPYVNEEDALIDFVFNGDTDRAQHPLRAFQLLAKQWAEDYPDYITYQEVSQP